jgi:hypothetical protein
MVLDNGGGGGGGGAAPRLVWLRGDPANREDAHRD